MGSKLIDVIFSHEVAAMPLVRFHLQDSYSKEQARQNPCKVYLESNERTSTNMAGPKGEQSQVSS